MEHYYEALSGLETKLEQLEIQASNIYEYAEQGIPLCRKVLDKMRERVMEKGFKNWGEECKFFKFIKPTVVGRLIHFMNLVHIERLCPVGDGKAKYKFYINHIASLRNYFLEHAELYEYYIRNLSHLDREYFTRNLNELQLYPESIVTIIDIKFATAKDMVFAQIIGNTLTIDYLKRIIVKNNPENGMEKNGKSQLRWTGAKVDLVELVYALHSSGVLSHGRADLKEIAQTFETVMHIKLGDYYRTFLEIRNRKIQPTKFLDSLKTNLQKRMEEADG